MAMYDTANDSYEVFWELEIGQRRIIKFIAEKGPLNITELGKLNSRYTATGFDRWGVLNRIKGSSKFLGLLEYDYLQEIQINKKEIIYELTLKGLLYSLAFVSFEENYMVKRYRALLKTHLRSKKEIENIVKFIKYEISYVLRYNAIAGMNWKKFKKIPGYLENLREPDRADYFAIQFHVELNPEELYTTQVDELARNYFNYHHWCWRNVEGSTSKEILIEPKQIFQEWKRYVLEGGKFNETLKKTIIYNLFCRMWMFAIIEPHFEENIHDFVWLYFKIRGFDVRLELIKIFKNKKNKAKFTQNKQIQEKLASMFDFVYLN